MARKFGKRDSASENVTSEDESTNVFSEDASVIANEITNEGNEMTENTDIENVTENTDVNTDTENESPFNYTSPRVPIEEIHNVLPTLFPDTGEDAKQYSASVLAASLAEIALAFRNSYLDNYEKLKGASFDDSEANVFAMARDPETQNRSGFVATLLEAAEAAKKQYEESFSKLIAEVKEAHNIIHLTDETKEALEVDASKSLNSVNASMDNMRSYERMNPGGTIQPVIDWLENLPALPSLKTKRNVTAGSSEEGSTRPRLGEKRGGYIKIGEKKFKNFASAMPALKTALKALGKDRDITTPELHKIWISAAGVSSGNWQEVPVYREIQFDIEGLPIAILRKA